MRLKVKILVILAVAVIAFGAVKTVYEKGMNWFFPFKYGAEVAKYAKENNLPEYLVAAVINAESGFDKDASSHIAKGLMQITDETAEWICAKIGIDYYDGITYDAEANIRLGCWYLRFLIDKYDNLDTALAAYNAGLGNVNKWLSDREYSSDRKTLRKIPFSETEKYILRVRRMMGIYQKAY